MSRPSAGPSVTWFARGLGAVVVVLAVVSGSSSVAWAHVSLVSSDPQNVSTAPGPVAEVRLTFSPAAADPVADEFRVVGAAGGDVPVESISNDGAEVLVLRLREPLASGRTSVTWAIRSGDSHTMTGTLAFTVAETGAGTGTAGPTGAGDADPVVEAASGSAGAAPGRGVADHAASVALWLVYGAAFICIGGLAYLAFVHRGTTAECRRLVFYVRRAAVVVLAASTGEWLARVAASSSGSLVTAVSPAAWADLAGTGFAKGTGLRLLGAALVLAFVRADVHDWDDEDRFERMLEERIDTAPSGGVAVAEAPARPLSRVRVAASPGAFLGAAMLVVSEAFIGHTATVSPRLPVLLSDAGHLVAAAAWASGALMLALTLGSRRRRGEPLDARLLATRFSVMATWCLAAVAATGTVLAWSILDGPSGLWASEFGRMLLVKLVLVAGLVALGAYNHLVLVPGLRVGDRGVEDRFARTVLVEVGLFAAVLAATALLVVSSPA